MPRKTGIDHWVNRWKRMVQSKQGRCCSGPSKDPRDSSSGRQDGMEGRDAPSQESLISLMTAGTSASVLPCAGGRLGRNMSPHHRYSRFSSPQHIVSFSSAASSASYNSSIDDGCSSSVCFRRQSSAFRRSTRSVLGRPRSSQDCFVSPAPPPLNLHPMQFELPCIDKTVPFIGREWLFHELYEILVRPDCSEANRIRGAVICGADGTGKTALLYHLASQAPGDGYDARAGPTANALRSSGVPLHKPGPSSSVTDAGMSTDSGFINSSHLSLSSTHLSNPSQYGIMVADSVLAYHFCQMDVVSTCQLSAFLINLISMLGTAPQLSAYADYLSRNPDLLKQVDELHSLLDPVGVFRSLIVEPLQLLRKCNKIPVAQNCLILIDSIDEAEYHRPEQGDSICSFILKYFIELPSWIRTVVTVRSSALDIVRGFPLHKISLDNVSSDDRICRDIGRYIAWRVDNTASCLRRAVRSGSLTALSSSGADSSFTSRLIDYMISICNGNFLYLKMVLNLFEHGHLSPSKGSSLKSLPINIAEVLSIIFNLKFSTVRSFDRVRSILSICLASLQPLTAQQIYECINSEFLETFLTWEEFCERLLSLSDFLIQREDETFQLIHLALRNWLIRRSAADNEKFICDTRRGHSLIAFRHSRASRDSISSDDIHNLGHHVLKGHIYRDSTSQDIHEMAPRNLQAYWVALSVGNVGNALASISNALQPNTKVSRLLLLAGANPNATTKLHNQAPLLCVASERGYVEFVSLLLEFKADVLATGLDGLSPLMHASSAGHLDVVQLLHEHGARLSQVDGSGWCALVHAAAGGHDKICSFLLQCDWTVNRVSGLSHELANCDEDDSLLRSSYSDGSFRQNAVQQAFVIAASMGNTNICRFMLEFGDVIIDQPDPTSCETALSLACRNGHKETVQYLLEFGAQVVYDHESSPLVEAVMGGCWEVVSSILAKGADVNSERNNKGRTALMVAASNGHIAVMELVLSRNAEIDMIDNDGQTALILASINGMTPCASLLLDRGSNVEHIDRVKRAAIHHAAANGNARLVQLLLDRGASLDHPDSVGMRPLDIAICADKLDPLPLFLRRGAKLSSVTWSVSHEKFGVMIMLLKKLLEDGNVLYKRNRLKEALQRYQYALKKFPSNIPPDKRKQFMDMKHDLLVNSARTKRKTDATKEAIDLLNQAMLLRPSSFESYFIRSRCHRDLNCLRMSYSDAAEAVRLMPSSREARTLLMRIQEQLRPLAGPCVDSAGKCEPSSSNTPIVNSSRSKSPPILSPVSSVLGKDYPCGSSQGCHPTPTAGQSRATEPLPRAASAKTSKDALRPELTSSTSSVLPAQDAPASAESFDRPPVPVKSKSFIGTGRRFRSSSGGGHKSSSSRGLLEISEDAVVDLELGKNHHDAISNGFSHQSRARIWHRDPSAGLSQSTMNHSESNGLSSPQRPLSPNDTE